MFLNIKSMSEISVLSECASWSFKTYSLMRRKTDMSVSFAWSCNLTESCYNLLCYVISITSAVFKADCLLKSHNTVSQSSWFHDIVVTHFSESMRLIRSEASSKDESVSITSYISFTTSYECSHHWLLIWTAAAQYQSLSTFD